MPRTMRSPAIFRAKIRHSSTGRMLTPRIHNVHVAKGVTVLFAMAWSSTCRTKCRLLVAPLELTPFAPDIVKSMLPTVRSAIPWPSADWAMSWVFIAPSDLAAPVHNINAALGRVLFAIHALSPHMTEGRPLIAGRLDATARHLLS
jgi:hypothetical protein